MRKLLIDKINKLKRHNHLLGGQNYSAVILEDVIGIIETDITIDLLESEIEEKGEDIFNLVTVLKIIYANNGEDKLINNIVNKVLSELATPV